MEHLVLNSSHETRETHLCEIWQTRNTDRASVNFRFTVNYKGTIHYNWNALQHSNSNIHTERLTRYLYRKHTHRARDPSNWLEELKNKANTCTSTSGLGGWELTTSMNCISWDLEKEPTDGGEAYTLMNHAWNEFHTLTSKTYARWSDHHLNSVNIHAVSKLQISVLIVQ